MAACKGAIHVAREGRCREAVSVDLLTNRALAQNRTRISEKRQIGPDAVAPALEPSRASGFFARGLCAAKNSPRVTADFWKTGHQSGVVGEPYANLGLGNRRPVDRQAVWYQTSDQVCTVEISVGYRP